MNCNFSFLNNENNVCIKTTIVCSMYTFPMKAINKLNVVMIIQIIINKILFNNQYGVWVEEVWGGGTYIRIKREDMSGRVK